VKYIKNIKLANLRSKFYNSWANEDKEEIHRWIPANK
jgi:hypothetical protein